MKRILVVDDEKDVEILFRQYFRKSVSQHEVELSFAFSGDEALSLIRNFNHNDALIILSDINMPGMTGIELLEKIKVLYPQSTVFMISAYDREDYRQAAIKLGAEDFFPKPVDFTALKKKIILP